MTPPTFRYQPKPTTPVGILGLYPDDAYRSSHSAGVGIHLGIAVLYHAPHVGGDRIQKQIFVPGDLVCTVFLC